MFEHELQQALSERRQQHRYRQRLLVSSPQTARLDIDNQSLVNFASNDYLGLANHPDVIAAMQTAAAEVGVGSGASHLVCGHSYYHHQLEQALATFTGRPRALLFSTGYMANMGVVSALVGRGDKVFEDRLNHASLIDAGLLCRAQFTRFRHNDREQLNTLLKASTSGRKLIVVDGVFSMDGDTAPLDSYARLCADHQAVLMVDDAHGFGILGEQGGGCAQHFGLSTQDLPILVGTLGKAFGTFGAFVAGSEALIETLIQFARTYIYTTALPPSVAAASLVSLDLLQHDHHRRERLRQRIQQFRLGAGRLNLRLMESSTPIQALVLGNDSLVLQVATRLKQQGILVGAIRPPTVPEGSARLRITFSAAHTTEDVDRLLTALDVAIPLEQRA
ncbi:MAG: 8-amino-7-oxononanoate synthase [Pseudomonadota bacterium]